MKTRCCTAWTTVSRSVSLMSPRRVRCTRRPVRISTNRNAWNSVRHLQNPAAVPFGGGRRGGGGGQRLGALEGGGVPASPGRSLTKKKTVPEHGFFKNDRM